MRQCLTLNRYSVNICAFPLPRPRHPPRILKSSLICPVYSHARRSSHITEIYIKEHALAAGGVFKVTAQSEILTGKQVFSCNWEPEEVNSFSCWVCTGVARHLKKSFGLDMPSQCSHWKAISDKWTWLQTSIQTPLSRTCASVVQPAPRHTWGLQSPQGSTGPHSLYSNPSTYESFKLAKMQTWPCVPAALLYYCAFQGTVRFKMFSLFFMLVFLCIICVKSIWNLL